MTRRFWWFVHNLTEAIWQWVWVHKIMPKEEKHYAGPRSSSVHFLSKGGSVISYPSPDTPYRPPPIPPANVKQCRCGAIMYWTGGMPEPQVCVTCRAKRMEWSRNLQGDAI